MTVLIGKKYIKMIGKPLRDQGFAVIPVPDNPNVDARLSGHVDLSVFVREKTAVLAQYLKSSPDIVNLLSMSGYRVCFAKKSQYPQYPGDATLCAKCIGSAVIHSEAVTDPVIRSLTDEWIDVRQGYSACSVLVVDDRSLITSDRGIAATAAAHGIEVLQIRAGHIKLEGFDYGFFGGAAFAANDTVYFTGDPAQHPDGDKIIRLIRNRRKSVEILTDSPMFDIGGAVVLPNAANIAFP